MRCASAIPLTPHGIFIERLEQSRPCAKDGISAPKMLTVCLVEDTNTLQIISKIMS